MPVLSGVVCGPAEVLVPAHLSYGLYLLEQLRQGGDRVAQICADTGRKTTYHEILQKSVNLAVSLRQLGLKKGDVVSISSENRFEFTISSLAVICVGGVLSTLNITYSLEELNHMLNLTKPKYIFTSPLSAKRIDAVAKQFPSVEKIILFGEEQLIPAVMYESLIASHFDVNDFEPADVNGKEDTMAVMSSSGTTGLPKGVMLTHVNFMVLTMHYSWYLEQTTKGRKVRTAMSLIPWFHAYGFITHFSMLCLHIENVFMIRFDETKYLQALQDHKVNLTFIVPPIAVFFAKHPLVSKYDLSSLNDVWCGAAPLSKDVQQAASKRIGIQFIRQGFGFTEMTMACMVDISDGSKTGSCGSPGPGIKVKVCDIETGQPLGPFKEGELLFKSPLVMKGYIGDKEASDALFDPEGFIRSGDIGYYDNDGCFYVIDRLKELIKYKGFQVAPAELEAILLQHPGVRECGVVGTPDELAGELPLAFVAPQTNTTLTEAELMQFVQAKVSPAKRLRGGVIFVQEIPKNPSGKILRRELRKMLKKVQSKL